MRLLLTILVSATFLVTNAQSHLPITSPAYGYGYGFTPWSPFMTSPFFPEDNLNKKWQLKPYASVSTGYIFLNGGVSYLSAPMGVALLHPLNKNVTAFSAVSVAPTVFSLNNFYPSPGINPSYNLGLNSRIEGGLIYTNDAKTFSISGRLSVDRGSYPAYPYYPANTKRQ